MDLANSNSRKGTSTAERKDNQQVLAIGSEYESAKHALDEIDHLLGPGGGSDLKKLFVRARNHLGRVELELSNRLGPGLYNAGGPTTASTALAGNVSETPELFKAIMLQLHASDVLAVQQVSRNMCAKINNSPVIQKYLGLRPDPQAFFRTHFGVACDCSSFFCSLYYRYGFHTHPIPNPTRNPRELIFEVGFDRAPADQALPRIGSRWRSMLICQPPVKELVLHLECCEGSYDSNAVEPPARRPPAQNTIVISASGITVGDIYDITHRLRQEHRLCPFAPRHDGRGMAMVYCLFRARLLLDPDDPTLKAWHTADAKARAQMAEGDGFRLRLGAYGAAKLTGEVTFRMLLARRR